MIMEWIKIDDKLPPVNSWVLGYTASGDGYRVQHLFVDSINNGKVCWLLICGDWDSPVTHWMPEPEPPKE